MFARRAKKALVKGQSPSQELEVSLRSRLYLLVLEHQKWPKIGTNSVKSLGLRPKLEVSLHSGLYLLVL